MTEEEKQAIKSMKKFARYKDSMSAVSASEMNIILNLVEKLQKENEEYKLLNANIEKANRIIEGKEDYIPKDKIRNLLKIYNISTDLSKTRDLESCDIFVDDIIELLEEE